MKESYFGKIPPQEVTPPVEKIPPQEIVPPLLDAADFDQAENSTEKRSEKAIDLMAAAESGANESEKEYSPEKKEILENARAERLGILDGVFTRVKGTLEGAKEKIDEKMPKPAQELLSQLMDVSSLKMYTEAGRGKSLTGKELSPKERVLSALIAGTNDLAKGLFAYAAGAGNAEYAQLGSLAYGASWALLLAKNGPKMLQNLKELASYYQIGEAIPVLARAEASFDQYGYPNLAERFAPSA